MKTPKRLPPETYKTVYSTVPRLCVDLVIRRNGRLLLIRRDIEPGRGLWHLPGGTILMGESIDAARQRIVKEETGLEVMESELIGMLEFAGEDNPFFHTVSAVYHATTDHSEPRGSRQGKEVRFWDRIPDDTIPEQKVFLMKYKLI